MEGLVGNAHFIQTICCSLPFYLVWERRSHTSHFSTTPLIFFQLHVHNVIPCLRPLLTDPSPEGLNLRLWGGLTFLNLIKKSTDL